MRPLLRAVRALLARRRFERDMREELAAHIEHRADDLAARGIRREDARRQARVEFGALEAYKEQCRDASGFFALRPLHGIGGDLKLAARRLAATPLFTLFAVLSLGLGLGVAAAAYSVVSAVAFVSPGILDEDQVAFVMTGWGGRLLNGGISLPDFEDVRRAQRSFTSMSAAATFYPAVAMPTSTDQVRAEAVDGAYFATLGIEPALGRAIDGTDDANAHAVVVLSDALWRIRFRSDPAIIGQQLRVGGRPFEIVGVAPAGFEGLGQRLRGTHLWIPLSADPRQPPSGSDERDHSRLVVFGRLAPGTTMASASAELTAVGASLDAAYPRSGERNGPRERAWLARPMAHEREGDEILFQFGVAFVVLVALVLVVACTNLANLVLARGTGRTQEYAVRRAIGASRWRLVREACTESVLIALLGTGVAWMVFSSLSTWFDVDVPTVTKMMVSFAPRLDPMVVVIAFAALMLSLLVFGLEPALQLTRDRDLRGELSAGAGSVGVPKAKRQRRLVRWQVAISTGFFIIATASMKYAIEEARHGSGIDLDRIAVATMNFWAQQWDDAKARRTVARVIDEVQKDPSVESAAVSSGYPFGTTGTPRILISTPGEPFKEDSLAVAVSSRFFRTAGIGILRGRGIDDRDHAGAPAVVVVSERTARRLFGTADVVGREILMKDRSGTAQARSVARKLALPTGAPADASDEIRRATIVGIASETDVVHLFTRDGDVVYLPFDQHPGVPFAIISVRTQGDPYVALRALRQAMRRVDPDLAVESSGTGIGALGGATVYLRALSALAISLGGLTLLLAMVGLYGIQAQGVSMRTREIGVRMSFGATAAQIRRLVLADGYRPVLQGLGIGLFMGLAGRAAVRSFWYRGIDVVDPWMLFAVPVPLLLAAFFACFLPAYRASRVDPNVALRHL